MNKFIFKFKLNFLIILDKIIMGAVVKPRNIPVRGKYIIFVFIKILVI